MHDKLLMVYVKLETLVSSEEGQDLVEYGLLCTLVALASISGLGPVAAALTRMFTNISTSLA
jgi:Flp pilus assembly pilin Flp